MASLARDRDLAFKPQTERMGMPFVGAFILHGGLFGAICLFGLLNFRHHGESWGTATPGGTIQASLVSQAALPLPQDQKPNENVLATETPSPAPAPPAPKAAPIPQEEAIPIAQKNQQKKQDKQVSKQNPPKQPPPPPTNRAQYGQQAAGALPRATSGGSTSNPVSITGGDFGSKFGYYVSIVQRKVRENWYTQEIDPHTKIGSQVVVTFSIHRDGSVSNIQIQQGSNSPSFNDSAIRAVRRVDTFGALPGGYNQSSVSVAYTFTFDQNH